MMLFLFHEQIDGWLAKEDPMPSSLVSKKKFDAGRRWEYCSDNSVSDEEKARDVKVGGNGSGSRILIFGGKGRRVSKYP